MRLRYCDGKDKYFPHTRIKEVETNIFLIKQLAKHLILSQGWLIKRNVQNEPFVTKFPFILTNLGIWKLSENDPRNKYNQPFESVNNLK